MLLGALPQAVEIIFEVQMKRSNEKIAGQKKKAFQLTKHFFFFSLDPLYLKNFQLSPFLFILNDLKCYRSVTFSSTNHFRTLIKIE
jgi:hypothetical protein